MKDVAPNADVDAITVGLYEEEFCTKAWLSGAKKSKELLDFRIQGLCWSQSQGVW